MMMVAREFDISNVRELALDAIPQGVLITDSFNDNLIIYSNAAFGRLTGYSAEEVIGRNCRFLQGPDTSQATRQQIREAIRNRREFQGLILNYRKDGTPFWNELTLAPVEEERESRYFIGVQLDVTQRIELEARLRESQKMEALGKLSGGVAHDFNNILALILGNAELIAEEAKGAPIITEAASDIIEAAEGGSNLVARMLQFARGQKVEAKALDVNQSVRDVVALLDRTIGEPIRMKTDLSPALGEAHVDKTLLDAALLNLALNARDAMPQGGVIEFKTRRRSNVGPGLESAIAISVSDTGLGMTPATAERAFEPFFTTKAAGRGTGLGLAMVYSFTKQAGGDVLLEREAGRGTSVTLLLPCRGLVAADQGVAEKEGTRVLVVEDDPKVRKVMAHHLRRSGYALEEAGDAEEAVHLLAQSRYSHLISDIRLPGATNGIELAHEARAVNPELTILLVTGFADELGEFRSEIDGIPVLRKPFKIADLLLALADAKGSTATR